FIFKGLYKGNNGGIERKNVSGGGACNWGIVGIKAVIGERMRRLGGVIIIKGLRRGLNKGVWLMMGKKIIGKIK
uniref:hypothetical protein n=1 Tax=Staphylococcus aureus TaxID=1280 RepID=UPI001C92D865